MNFRDCPILGHLLPALLIWSVAVSPLFSSGPRSSDVLNAALRQEFCPVPRQARWGILTKVDVEAAAIASAAGESASIQQRLSAANNHFFGPEGFTVVSDMAGPENTSVAVMLENRRGTCVGLAIAYLALVRRVGLDAHAVATPVHVFVRVHVGNAVHNVELTEDGLEIDDESYRRRYRIDEASIASGAFMQELSDDELIAHLLSNQAVALSKQGRVKDALKRYDRALKLNPKLVAAWYNQGIDLMAAGRPQKALESFDRALELYPSDAQAHNNRGLAKMKLGDVEGAREDWLKALALEPGMAEAEANLRRLKQ